MTIANMLAALMLTGLLAACAQGGAPDTTPIGAPVDPMTDSGLSPDPMNPGVIDDAVGTQM